MNYHGTVLIFSLTDPTRSQHLLAELRRDSDVRQALIVERTTSGQLRVKDAEIARGAGVPVVAGGAIGALLGVLGGPLGMLLGWSVGAMGGMIYSAVDADDDEDGFQILSAGIAAGSNVVMAEIVDDVYPAEQRALEYGGTVVRVPGEQITFEVESAKVAADLAAVAARKARRNQKSDDFKAGMRRLFHHEKADV